MLEILINVLVAAGIIVGASLGFFLFLVVFLSIIIGAYMTVCKIFGID